MDDRSIKGMFKASRQQRDEETKTATLLTMFFAFLTGLLFLFAFVVEDHLVRMTIYFTLFGFMLTLFLITDFSHILLDVKDNLIILPKPLSSQTFVVSRLLHILIHVTKILVPIALPGFLTIWIMDGFWGAILLVPVLSLLSLLTFSIVNALYLLIIRFFKPEKINSIITTFQIIFSVVLFGGYQLFSRFIGRSLLEQIDFSNATWIWIFPSYWMASAWTFLFTFSSDTGLIIGTILSVIAPFAGAWIMIRYFGPVFFSKLSMISSGSTSVTQIATNTVKDVKPFRVSSWLAKLFTQEGIERASFSFTWNMTARDKEFRLKVYPQVGYVIVLLIIFIFNRFKDWDPNELEEISSRVRGFLLIIFYLSGMVYLGAMFQLAYHANPASAWIYYRPSLTRPGPILSGAIRACIARFYLPFILTIAIVALPVFGIRLLPNLLCALSNVLLVCILFGRLFMDKLPFSFPLKAAAEGQSVLRNFFMWISLSLLGIPQYFLFDYPLILLLIALISGVVGYVILNQTRKLDWSFMEEN